MTARFLEVNRDDLRRTRLLEHAVADPGPGQALLRIDRFGLTANNVTYGVAGDQMGYWRFFPTEDGWGRLPVWGFADVAAGDVPGLEVGTRVFGYLPMGTHLLVEPEDVTAHGFNDATGHRRGLPAPYNAYRRCDADPLYSPTTEGLQAVLLPLFLTSFVLDDYLADNGFFGAGQVVVTSASAKTSIGTACLIARRADRPTVVGITSRSRLDFVRSLGCYDEVAAYSDVAALDALPTSTPTLLVDVAGDRVLRADLHRRFADSLRHSCVVGLSHWDAALDPAAVVGPLPGPRPTLFFAPAQVEARVAAWGPQAYQQRLAQAWQRLRDAAGSWMRIVTVPDLDAGAQAYQALLDGRTSPDEGLVVVAQP